MVADMRRIVPIVCTVISLGLMGLVVCAKGLWLLIAVIALDSGPIPWAYKWNALVFIGVFVSTLAFWKLPYIAVVVAWIDLLSILVIVGVNWPNVHFDFKFLDQFRYDYLFFVVAILGFIARRQVAQASLLNRGVASPMNDQDR